MQNTLTLSMNLDTSFCPPESSEQSASAGTGSAPLLDHRMPANQLALRFSELVQMAKADHFGKAQPVCQSTITPIAHNNTESGQPTFSDAKSDFDYPRLEKGWKRSSVRGAVHRADEDNVVRKHSWGPRLEDNFDESLFPDGHSIRRDREGTIFECFPPSNGNQYFRLTKTDGREFCWKGTLRAHGHMGITVVEAIPDQELCKYRARAEHIGLPFSQSTCIRLNWEQSA
jgi:hypothetical protein